ncbi:hypothetical protein CFC21_005842 [Triticum aestivum]|uniref:Uncharacterized protein n=2 Tax=Triticum aestivum TaxID=4565 RepID=A0A3B5YTS1_WHEAT|nr:hypothetical protein CFC21_005842 [Triticum aestivum]
MKNSKIALFLAMLFLVISASSATAPRDAPAGLAKKTHSGIMNEANDGFAESKGIIMKNPVFRPPKYAPCASKAVRPSGDIKEEKLC